MSDQHSRDFVASFAKGLRVIKAFNGSEDRLTLSDVAKLSGLTRAGARRLLLTLGELGYIEQSGRYFSLTPRILELGFPFFTSHDWIARAAPLMKSLADRFQESCSASVLDGADIVYVARIPTCSTTTMTLHIGTRMPALYAAMGRIQLGALSDEELNDRFDIARIERLTKYSLTSRQVLIDRIRADWRQGYSLVDQELEIGFRALAVPVLDRRGEVVGALNLPTQSSRTTVERMEQEYLPALMETRDALSRLIF